MLAGAAPLLQQNGAGGYRLVRMRPGSQPLAALDGALATHPDSRPALLVVDQFEEIFTHVAALSVRQDFARKLWALSSNSQSELKTAIILILRVDFIGRCGELALDEAGLCLDRISYDEAHRMFVTKLGPTQLRSVIEAPARMVGLELKEGLSNRLLQELGALPLLEDTLDLLWQHRSSRVLTQRTCDEIGGVTGALTGRADALFDALAEAAQTVAKRLLVRLIDPNLGQKSATATRRQVSLAAICAGTQDEVSLTDRILARLVDARLLVTSKEGDENMVEVVYEALIRKWTRQHAWVRADQVRLAGLEEFAAWGKRWRDYGTLLIDYELAHAESLATHCGPDLGSEQRRLLAPASQSTSAGTSG